MNKNKIRKLFAVAVISGAVMTGLNNIAYAVVTDYAIKVNDQVYSYNQAQLEDSFLDYKSGNDSKLYEDFRDKLAKATSFHAFKDDKKGFIPYENIEEEFLKAKNDKKAFNINKFIEEFTCESMDVKSVKKVSMDEKGSILIKDNDNKTKETDDSEKSSSSSRSSRGSSSSKSKKEETKKVVPDVQPVPEVKKDVIPEVKKEEPKKVVPEVKKEEKKEEVKPVIKKEEKKPEVIVKKEEPKKVVPEVKPEPVNPQGFEAIIKEDSKRVVEEAKKPQDISSKTKGNVSIKSEITQTAQKPYIAQKQITTILIDGEAKADGTIEILGHKIEIKKGDHAYGITTKIEKEFKNDKVWEVKYKYGQWEGKGNITFYARGFAENVNITVNPSNLNGVIFKVKNEQFGELAISERGEICTATVLNNSTTNEKIKIKVHSEVIRKTFATVEVEIKAGETKEKIAEKIANKLKEDKTITQYFTVENKGSQVNLTQKHADAINTAITIQNDSDVAKIEVKPAIKKEEKQPEVVVKKEEPKKVVSEVKKDNVPSMAEQLKQHIKVDSRRVVKEVEKPEDTASKTKGNVSIKSEITQTSQKLHMAKKQITTIFVEGEAKTDGTIEILGHKIEIKKGEGYHRVINTIEKEFKDDKVWEVKYRYGQWGEMGNITFYSKEFAEHVNITIKPSNLNALTFEVKDDQCGELAISERRETCTATVLNNSTADEKIKIKVHSDVIRKTFAIVEVEIKKGETKEQIAENIANKLKKDKTITQYFIVENKGAQVNLRQKHADVLNLAVTVQ